MTRHLILVLGDQLDPASAAFDGFDPAQDAILMAEVRQEATYIPQHRKRVAYFFAAMRHAAQTHQSLGRKVHFTRIDDRANTGTLASETIRHLQALNPSRLIVLEPGDHRVKQNLAALGYPTEWREDRHFLLSSQHATAFFGRHKRPILETFYRHMRRELNILLDPAGNPIGGAWNFDKDNRESFKRNAPPIPQPLRFPPDATTQSAIAAVKAAFPHAPGKLDDFDLPVTQQQAKSLLAEFVRHRLPHFGTYQDAMRQGEPFLFHSRLSGPLNLHLLDPREVVHAALENPADAPLNAVEGFVRQIIGWREFIRAIYWQHMPDYAAMNALEADLPMPAFYWTGETEMACLRDAITHTIDHAYAHHIERLMVLGLFALLLGVRPHDVHRWHMSMFWDAIDWVSLPNVVGMGQAADGGLVGTKPYAASGAYIDRMSNHCKTCRYQPGKSTGPDACPFTTLYWDFLARHQTRFARNMRMRNSYANLNRKPAADLRAIAVAAEKVKAAATATTFLD